MRLIWKWPLNPARNKAMSVANAAAHALADSDPEARQEAAAEILARLIHVLHNKGVLLPAEVVQVLGDHAYREAEPHEN